MKISRLAALVAVPVALSLAACGGGSTSSPTIANITGNNASIRVINGDAAPTEQSLDVYFQSSGTGAPTTPLLSGLAYGVASDFTNEPATGASLLVQTKGGTPPSGGATLASCPLPQLQVNAKYSLVIVRTNGVVNCRLFQDFDYTSASPQYRFHNASGNNGANGTSGLTFGTAANPFAAPTFVVQGLAMPGIAAAGANGATTFTQAQPVTTVSNNVTFAVGTGAVAVGGTDAAVSTLNSSSVFATGGTTQPNTSGQLNPAGSVGTSIFALDCTAASVATLPGVTCGSGVALVGETDRL